MKKPLLMATAVFGLYAATVLTLPIPSAQAQEMITAAPVVPRAAAMTDEQLRGLGQGIAFPYELLERALRPNINKEGAVFYNKLKGNNDLETFVRAVAVADLAQFPKWMNPPDPNVANSTATPDRTPELTFYINAYNGLFLKAISDAYPVNSPGQIKGLMTAKTRRVAGKDYSFAELRKEIAGIDPRALFALPDGTNNGPRATAAAYSYSGLGGQLNRAVQYYVNDLSRVEAPIRLQNTVQVSPWMMTVDEFFAPKSGRQKFNGIRNILSTYTTRDSDQRYFATGDYQIRFALGDASINEQLSR